MEDPDHRPEGSLSPISPGPLATKIEEPKLFFSDDSDDESDAAGPSSHSGALFIPDERQVTPGSPLAKVKAERAVTPDGHSDIELLPTPKKKRSEPDYPSSSNLPKEFRRGYIGEFCSEGWSLSKGKGYCSAGAKIYFERQKPEKQRETEAAVVKTGPGKLVNGKFIKGTPAKAIGGKQMTLGAMGLGKKPPVTKKAVGKKKPDHVIRFKNERGFEVGRLPVNDASFLAHLLDTGIIDLDGHVIDCPDNIRTGDTILLSIRVFLTRQAFSTPVSPFGDRKEKGQFWQDEKETEEEEAMRTRKDALGTLFARIGIKPLRSNAIATAQKKNGKIVLNDKSLTVFKDQASQAIARRSVSPVKQSSRMSSPGSATSGKLKGKGKATVDDDDDSGDEAEKLDDAQMNELEAIYRKAQMNDQRLGEMDPPDTFLYTLRPYQKQALMWMNGLEIGDTVRDESLHPLWEEYAFKKETDPNGPIVIDDDDDVVDPSRLFYWNPYSGELDSVIPKNNTRARGGILADAMGMGKTCMLAALMHLNREGDAVDPDDSNPGTPTDEESAAKRRKFKQITLSNQWRAVASTKKATPSARATLVVCPVSLASQWESELTKMSSPGSLRSVMWHGNDRKDIELLLAQEGKQKVDVIITSYGTLASEHAKWHKEKDKSTYEGGNIFDYEFLRVVLDEAHNIKNRTAQSAKACYDLKAQRRWALSGTPIVNRLEDLYSLLHFLQLDPWGQYSFFRTFVTLPFLSQDPKALNVVQYILETCLLRREKTMRDRDGKLIVDLPEKTVTIESLVFSRTEKKIYQQLEDRAKRRFIELDNEGKATANYTSILAMLMKLRQAVDHPLLVMNKIASDEKGAAGDDLLASKVNGETSLKDMIAMFSGGADESQGEVDPAYAIQVLKELGEAEEVPECMMCHSEIFDEVLLPCYHRGCRDCIDDYIGRCEDLNQDALCPVCQRGPYTSAQLTSVKRRRARQNPLMPGQNSEESKIVLNKIDLVASTKLRALSRKLEALREQDPTAKALVFSQFTSFLDLIESTLNKDGVKWLRFDGSMSQAQRAATVEEFGKPSTEPVVLLISLKAGGVGLNLTMANHVFMMDCWWNEATEAQAIDRVHRLGQTKPVYVTRFIIRGTIEKRILKIQRSKTALVNASLAGRQDKDKADTMADIKAIFGLDDAGSDDEEL